MARSTIDHGPTQHELETLALIGGKTPLLWQMAGPDEDYPTLATFIDDHDHIDAGDPVDVRVTAFVEHIETQLRTGERTPSWQRLEREYGDQADAILEAARDPTPATATIELHFPGDARPPEPRTETVENAVAARVEHDKGGETAVYIEDADGDGEWYSGFGLCIAGVSLQEAADGTTAKGGE